MAQIENMYQSPEQTWDPSDMCGTLSTFEVDDWTTTRFVYAESYSRCSDHYKIVSPVLPLDIFEPQPIPRDQEQSIEAVLPDEIHQLLTDLEELPVDEIIVSTSLLHSPFSSITFCHLSTSVSIRYHHFNK